MLIWCAGIALYLNVEWLAGVCLMWHALNQTLWSK